jgi:GT2 family glycosyltransferase
VNETTAAADQVKFYEYVSRGKPVVSTWLPELEPFREHLYMVTSHEEFLAALDVAVAEDDDRRRKDRIALARANDWQARYEVMEEAIGEILPMLSVVVVTYANLELSKQCVESLFANTTQPRFEVIVVDNASHDGTPEYLRSRAATNDRLRVVLNDDNRGFAAAMNQGLELARGDVLVIMNNDIVVPSSWQTPMLRQLEHSDVGLVVASTNTSGNESRIPVTYHDVEEMEAFAAQRRRDHDGRSFDIRVATMFCVAMRREVYEAVGPLDEQFGIGMFEDDDYSHRTRLAGFRVVCAEDAFVHHEGQAALNTLSPRDLQALWDENQRRYEDKWSVTWEPHTLRSEVLDAEPDE